MDSITTKQPGKPPPPTAITYHADGRPILYGILGEPFSRKSRDQRITVVCPRCGKKNHHGWPINAIDDVPQHRQAHCDCWGDAPSGYYVVPSLIQPGDVTRRETPASTARRQHLENVVTESADRIRAGCRLSQSQLTALVNGSLAVMGKTRRAAT